MKRLLNLTHGTESNESDDSTRATPATRGKRRTMSRFSNVMHDGFTVLAGTGHSKMRGIRTIAVPEAIVWLAFRHDNHYSRESSENTRLGAKESQSWPTVHSQDRSFLRPRRARKATGFQGLGFRVQGLGYRVQGFK